VSAVPTVLVVDDYLDALQVWEIFLRSAGFDVVTAADGQSALEAVERQRPDIIVLDLELPVLSGFEVARQLKRNAATRSIPLIAATGYSYAKLLKQAVQSGFDTVVIKPCDPAGLVALIRRLLGKRQHSTSAQAS
jgi:two-component system cell cycle response regulator DivK